MKEVKIKNIHLLGLASWLNELELSGKETRIRSRFVTKLADRYQENEKFRVEMITKHSKLDEEGNPIIAEDGKSYEFDDKDALVKELTDLYNEKFTVTLPDDEFEALKKIVLDTDYVFGPKEGDNEQERIAKIRQANDYEVWCEVFESVEN